jgi:hypothetical protein
MASEYLWAENTQAFLLKARQAQLASLIGGSCSPEYAEKYDWSI